ncbi:MAG: hypothetical protein Q8M76_00565 [Spirochaetaceae bacterium]|nr:hypothetical protein [Spirochaetaceae bacterium]
MEAIRDLSWMRQLALSSVERFELRGFGIAIVSVPPTSAHHGDRFRYRLLAFDPGLGKPILSIDLESDILGDFCLSLQFGAEHKILARFDAPPSLEEFRSRAIAEAEAALPAQPEAKLQPKPKPKPRA